MWRIASALPGLPWRIWREARSALRWRAYAGALWALGLLPQMTVVADPDFDEEGKVLEDARRPTQAPRRMTLDNDF